MTKFKANFEEKSQELIYQIDSFQKKINLLMNIEKHSYRAERFVDKFFSDLYRSSIKTSTKKKS